MSECERSSFYEACRTEASHSIQERQLSEIHGHQLFNELPPVLLVPLLTHVSAADVVLCLPYDVKVLAG